MGRKSRQKLASPFTPGEVVNLYLDPKFQTELLGKGELIEMTEDSNNSKTFILEEMPEHKQEVFSLERWLIRIVETTELGDRYIVDEFMERDLRVLYCIGPCPTSAVSLKHLENMSSSNIVDKFIIVNGIEIF